MHGHGVAVHGTAIPVPTTAPPALRVQTTALPATIVQTTAVGGPLEPLGTARQVGQVGQILIEEVQFPKISAADATVIWIGSRL